MSVGLLGQMRFDEFTLDPARRILHRNGTQVSLTPKAFDVLCYLARNPERPVAKDELLKAVWPGLFVEEGNLAQHISMVRKALGDQSKLIATIPGHGYQFVTSVQNDSNGVVRGERGLVPLETVAAGPREGSVAESELLTSGASVSDRRAEREIQSEPPSPFFELKPAAAASSYQTLLWIAAILCLVGVAGWLQHVWSRTHTTAQDRHQVVLADFENKIGDASLDRSLNRAFKIDMGQSPYIDVMGEREVAHALQLMGRTSDTSIDAGVAREVCIRSNRQVVLTGSVFTLGPTYLLAVEATDCSTGKRIASAKADAPSLAKVSVALDRAAETMRSALGESAASLEKYKVPIAEATTTSLEALTSYSEGLHLDNGRTHSADVLPLYRRAIELDPNFALAYASLGEEYRRLGESDTAAFYFKRAFDLRDKVSTHERLILEAQYYGAGVGDLPRALEAYRIWGATFPYDSMPKSEPIRLYLEMGQYQAAIEAGEAGIKASPENTFARQRLVLAYMKANRFQDAKAAIAQAENAKSDSAVMHRFAYEIAFAEHDEAAMAREVARPKPIGAATYGLDFQRACATAATGRYLDARALFIQTDDEVEVEKLEEELDNFRITQAEMELQLGLEDAARHTLREVSHSNPKSVEDAYLRLLLGDATEAVHFLAAHGNDTDTLMSSLYVPRIRAALALHQGKPQDAIAALETARPYEMIDYRVLELRGTAYRQAGMPDLAVTEFQKIIANPGVDPVSPSYPLAYLGLAHAYAAQNRKPDSRHAYESLFKLWSHADPDLPRLIQARTEEAKLF